MSIYNKPDLKINIGCNTPSYHKKINSMNFTSSNTGRNQQENGKKYFSKNKFDLKHSTNLNSETNIISYNNQIFPNSNINKVLTSANLKNRKIEIDLNKNNSPQSSKVNKSIGENAILFNHKPSTSQNNINNKIINYNINNSKEINHNKSKNNNLNNINININISKKIISTYYNKSKDKKNLIVKKKSINSLNNSNKKENKNNKYNQPNNNGNNNNNDLKKNNNYNDIIKNQSERVFKKLQNNDSYLLNYYSNQGKNSGNHNSLAYFSTNSNMSTNTNKNNNFNNSNLYMNNNNPNFTRDEIYNNYYSNRDIKQKNYGNIFNKIIKENKSSCFSQIQSPIGINHTQGNVNSIQNYLKYLNIGQKNKNYKNALNISKNKSHKLSANNINYNHNNTESNIYNNNNNNIYNSTYNYETQTTFTQNNYKLNDENENIVPNSKRSKKLNESRNETKEIKGFPVESPEELHYFYVKLLQKGKKMNFDIKK